MHYLKRELTIKAENYDLSKKLNTAKSKHFKTGDKVWIREIQSIETIKGIYEHPVRHNFTVIQTNKNSIVNIDERSPLPLAVKLEDFIKHKLIKLDILNNKDEIIKRNISSSFTKTGEAGTSEEKIKKHYKDIETIASQMRIENYVVYMYYKIGFDASYKRVHGMAYANLISDINKLFIGLSDDHIIYLKHLPQPKNRTYRDYEWKHLIEYLEYEFDNGYNTLNLDYFFSSQIIQFNLLLYIYYNFCKVHFGKFNIIETKLTKNILDDFKREFFLEEKRTVQNVENFFRSGLINKKLNHDISLMEDILDIYLTNKRIKNSASPDYEKEFKNFVGEWIDKSEEMPSMMINMHFHYAIENAFSEELNLKETERLEKFPSVSLLRESLEAKEYLKSYTDKFPNSLEAKIIRTNKLVKAARTINKKIS